MVQFIINDAAYRAMVAASTTGELVGPVKTPEGWVVNVDTEVWERLSQMVAPEFAYDGGVFGRDAYSETIIAACNPRQ